MILTAECREVQGGWKSVDADFALLAHACHRCVGLAAWMGYFARWVTRKWNLRQRGPTDLGEDTSELRRRT